MKSATLEAASSATRGGGGAPSGWASLWECRAAQSHQARPEEVQEPSWGTVKGDKVTLTVHARVGEPIEGEVEGLETRRTL